MDMLVRTVKKLDCSSGKIALELDGSSRIKTVCGGVLSLTLWIASGICALYLLIPVLSREDPNINLFRRSNDESSISLSKLNLKLIPLSFGEYSENLGKSLQFEAALSRTVEGVSTVNTVIPLVQCKDSLCFDFNTTVSSKGEILPPEDNVLINGKNNQFSSLTVKIKTCSPKSEAYRAYFSENNSFEVKISANNQFLEADDFDSPVKSDLFELNSQFSLGKPSKTTLLFSENTVVSDKNFVFVAKESESYFEMQSFRQTFIQPNRSDNAVGFISFEASKFGETTTRIYPKIQGVLPEIAFLVRLLSSWIQIMAKPFSKYCLLSKIAKYKKRNPDLEPNNYVLVDKLANQTSVYINKQTYKQQIPSLSTFVLKQVLPWNDELKTNFELNVNYLDFEQLIHKLDKIPKLEHQLNQMVRAH